jgi:hypothetical protein
MKGMLYVDPEGVRREAELQPWLEEAMEFAHTLPEKRGVKGGTRTTRKR